MLMKEAMKRAMRQVNKRPPQIVKSVLVVQAYMVRATTIAAVNAAAMKTETGSYSAVIELTR